MSDAAAKTDGQEDLAILYPEREATIAGRAIVMREYGFAEGLRLGRHVRPVIDALAAAMGDGEAPTPQVLRTALSDVAESVELLVAAACDQPVEWVRRLGDADGQALMMLWWVTNADFFVRRVIEAIAVTQFQRPGGPTSSSPSPERASTSTGSSASPTAS